MNLNPLLQSNRIIIKVGSALLVDQNNSLRLEWLTQLAQDIEMLTKLGKQIIIVSSGSVALGRAKLKLKPGPLTLPQKQAAAAVGQIELAHAYEKIFSMYNIVTAQVLLTLQESENRQRYINAKNTLSTLLNLSVIPIINENDTVATSEIRYGDNDRLSARVAQMIEADTLVLFSDIDGLYTDNPHLNASAKHISLIEAITPEVEAMAGSSHSSVGTGGMYTKILAAKIATSSGTHMIICDGRQMNPLTQLLNGGQHTLFTATISHHNARKQWISNHLNATGTIHIDRGAEQALTSGKSLLAVGITAIEGTFDKGDVINVINADKMQIAMGITTYSAYEIERIQGQKGNDIQTILGYCSGQPIIHRNNLVLTSTPK